MNEGGERRNSSVMNSVSVLHLNIHLMVRWHSVCFIYTTMFFFFFISFLPMKVPVIAIFPPFFFVSRTFDDPLACIRGQSH